MNKTRPGSQKPQPKASRPEPAEYFKDANSGFGLLDWSGISARISAAMNYWICSVRPDGRPHCMPVWAVWIDEVLYFSTSPHSRKARNLAKNPRVSVHLESGDQAVIFEGAGGGVYAVTPHVAHPWRTRRGVAWLDSHEPGFSGSATRWQFDM